MSISVFQQNLTKFLDDPSKTESSDQFAEFLTQEYDTLIKSGFQLLAGVGILSANPSGMENILKQVLKATLNVTSNPTPIIQNLGQGILAYWGGAQLVTGPPPLPPSPGSLSNISSVYNPVLNVGTWVSPPQTPQPVTTPFVTQFVTAITTHLATISGFYITISLYSVGPVTLPGPGLVPWVGYTVP